MPASRMRAGKMGGVASCRFPREASRSCASSKPRERVLLVKETATRARVIRVTAAHRRVAELIAGVSDAALVATVGMFLAPFFNVLVWLPRLRRRFSGSAGAAHFSSWAIPVVIGGILATFVKLAVSGLQESSLVVIFAADRKSVV